jgi:hypothetical protein
LSVFCYYYFYFLFFERKKVNLGEEPKIGYNTNVSLVEKKLNRVGVDPINLKGPKAT